MADPSPPAGADHQLKQGQMHIMHGKRIEMGTHAFNCSNDVTVAGCFVYGSG